MAIKLTYEELEQRVRELEKAKLADKSAAEFMSTNEKHFSTIFQSNPIPIAMTSLSDNRLAEVNDAWLEVMGYTRTEVIDHTPSELNMWVEPSEREKFLEKLSLQEIATGEIQIRIKSGEILYFLMTGRYIDLAGVNYFLSMCQDITERKRAEEALRKNEANLSSLIENVDGAIWSVDRNYCLIVANSEFHQMVGTSGGGPFDIGENILSGNYEAAIIDRWRDYYDRALHGESFSTEIQVDVNDFMRTLEYRFSPINVDGLVTGVTVFGRDITDRKQLVAQLQQAQKMESIGNLAGGIAHDFNNILFPIVGMSEMLLEDLQPGSVEYENAEEILKAGRRGRDLVKQILAFSRQSNSSLTPVRIQKILMEVFKLTRSSIPSNIEIKQNVQWDCGMVEADPAQIHQIAMNLITNAYHAVESVGGEISVDLRETTLRNENLKNSSLKPGNYVLLGVSDTGHGIEQDHLNKIFEPYFTTKDKDKGTGLGLATVYGIVKEYNGEISVESRPGMGADFKVLLPLMRDKSAIKKSLKESESKGGTERVLVIDDEESVALLEKKMLERLGYQVTAFTNSLDALNVFRSDPDSFDAVVSDMTMPNMTGDQLAKELVSIRPDIPVIICTGFSERINKKITVANGIKGLLMKPVAKSEMAKNVRKVLDNAKFGTKG